MRRLGILAAVIVLSAPGVRAAEKWVLTASTLTYNGSHLLHNFHGTSHAARGKVVCGEAGCQLLIAAPVNTFESHDTNRDLHMLETTHGVQFPMVVVRSTMTGIPTGNELKVNLDVEFAGYHHLYKDVMLESKDRTENKVTIEGILPLTLSDFQIPLPSLLGVAMENLVPVAIATSWRRE